MDELTQIECRFSGPIPRDERWALRFGSPAAYERARAKAAIRHLTRRCMAAPDGSAFRKLFDEIRTWRDYGRAFA